MIRLGIILFQNMTYAPFLNVYESLLSEQPDIKYDVIYLNRDSSLGEVENEKYIPISWIGKGTTSASKYEKIINYALYSKKVKKVIKANKYDFLIILTTMPSVLLCSYLKKKYHNKFIVDIRDYTQEEKSVYFRREKAVFGSASLRIISSLDYKKFLPKYEYRVLHNFSSDYGSALMHIDKACDRPIIISNIGSLSYPKQIKRLIDLVHNDTRFCFHLYGNDGRGEITSYAKEKGNNRIRVMGAFPPNEKSNLYMASDIIFNCYGNERTLVKYAISNRFYDGAIYKKPLIVSPNTSMQRFSNGFAYALDLDAINNLDGLFEWYTNLDEAAYDCYANGVIKEAIETNARTLDAILTSIRGIK